jgi:hypothetical protein
MSIWVSKKPKGENLVDYRLAVVSGDDQKVVG